MTIIHMDTDEVRRKKTLMAQHVDDLNILSGRLRTIVYLLSSAIEGGNADQYNRDINSWISKFQSQAQELDTFCLRVSEEVDQWENMDKVGAFNPPDESWLRFVKSLQDDADYFSALKDLLLDGGEEYKGYLDFLESTGKDILNDFPGKIVCPFALEFLFELLQGRPLPNAALSSLLQLSTLLIPGYGELLLISSGVQLGGDAIVGLLDAFGDQHDAALIAAGFDAADVSGWTEKIGDAIADAILNPAQASKDIEHDVDSMKTFGAGLGGGLGWWAGHLLGV